jgi:hypothetical protein
MTYEKIIFGIGILIGILLLKKTKPKLLIGILVGLIISVILSFIDNQPIIYISFASFGILSLIIGIFAVISFFSKFMQYPYANELKSLMIVPIVSYVLTFRQKEKYENELSILTIFVAYELNEFIKLTEHWVK